MKREISLKWVKGRVAGIIYRHFAKHLPESHSKHSFGAKKIRGGVLDTFIFWAVWTMYRIITRLHICSFTPVCLRDYQPSW